MRGLPWIVAILAFTLIPSFAAAQEDGMEGPSNKQVGVGLVAGAAFPFANNEDYAITESWGFYVDIPVISTFHISPATTLYRLDHKKNGDIGNKGITDISLNFKFVIPLPGWKIWLAALMGISNGHFKNGDFIQPHVGGNTGFSYRVVSNLDILLSAQYKLIIDGDQRNINMIQSMAGLQFNF